jgi:leucyl aminopeptidase
MNLQAVQGNILEFETNCIVVNLFEGVKEPGGATGAVDKALNGALHRLIASGDFTGEAGKTALLYTNGQIPAERVMLVGLGRREKFDLHGVRNAAATAARELQKLKGVKTFATVVHGAGVGGLDTRAASQAVAEGTILATYRVRKYRRKNETIALNYSLIVEADSSKIAEVEQGVEQGEIIARAVCKARDLVSEPPNILTPGELAARARRIAQEGKMQYAVLGEDEMQQNGMNLLLAVSAGSQHEAQLVILEHAPEGHEEEQPLILVGKGVTFDTGGISIKAADEMWRMKNDMGGAATVIATMEAVSRLDLPRRVIGVAACVENMPDGKSFRPGDIITGMKGKTAEIISTDAEGRMILADALAYISRFKPSAVIDLATLTGAIGIALGKQAAGCFTNNDKLQNALLAASARSGERIWPMPMWEEYKEVIRSDMAEVKNSGGRYGGVSTSAKFLEHFVEDYPWAHLDIANVVWTDTAKAEVPKGATGFGVRLLIDLISQPGPILGDA